MSSAAPVGRGRSRGARQVEPTQPPLQQHVQQTAANAGDGIGGGRGVQV